MKPGGYTSRNCLRIIATAAHFPPTPKNQKSQSEQSEHNTNNIFFDIFQPVEYKRHFFIKIR